ncbi:MAG TPA: glycosyltransferase family 2 protein [Lachnospiraceae bacterium]|nr:glycosyltransferase family 2 protein [Lachnospiraceae bacterium]
MSIKVSIITATFNDADNLQKIVNQVKKQDYENIEYIIVDGASTDSTGMVIRDAKEFFGERLIFISEPDTGIYSAINKGIKLASGDVIGCCFDEFTSETVIRKMVEIIEKENSDGVHGDLNYMEGDRVIRRWHQGNGLLRLGWMPGHPTLYLKKKIYDTYGLYKEDYRVSADYEFMVRCFIDKKVKISYIPEVLIHMSYGGTSNKNIAAYLLSLKEGHRALKENNVKFAFFTDGMRSIRVLLQFLDKVR